MTSNQHYFSETVAVEQIHHSQTANINNYSESSTITSANTSMNPPLKFSSRQSPNLYADCHTSSSRHIKLIDGCDHRSGYVGIEVSTIRYHDIMLTKHALMQEPPRAIDKYVKSCPTARHHSLSDSDVLTQRKSHSNPHYSSITPPIKTTDSSDTPGFHLWDYTDAQTLSYLHHELGFRFETTTGETLYQMKGNKEVNGVNDGVGMSFPSPNAAQDKPNTDRLSPLTRSAYDGTNAISPLVSPKTLSRAEEVSGSADEEIEDSTIFLSVEMGVDDDDGANETLPSESLINEFTGEAITIANKKTKPTHIIPSSPFVDAISSSPVIIIDSDKSDCSIDDCPSDVKGTSHGSDRIDCYTNESFHVPLVVIQTPDERNKQSKCSTSQLPINTEVNDSNILEQFHRDKEFQEGRHKTTHITPILHYEPYIPPKYDFSAFKSLNRFDSEKSVIMSAGCGNDRDDIGECEDGDDSTTVLPQNGIVGRLFSRMMSGILGNRSDDSSKGGVSKDKTVKCIVSNNTSVGTSIGGSANQGLLPLTPVASPGPKSSYPSATILANETPVHQDSNRILFANVRTPSSYSRLVLQERPDMWAPSGIGHADTDSVRVLGVKRNQRDCSQISATPPITPSQQVSQDNDEIMFQLNPRYSLRHSQGRRSGDYDDKYNDVDGIPATREEVGNLHSPQKVHYVRCVHIPSSISSKSIRTNQQYKSSQPQRDNNEESDGDDGVLLPCEFFFNLSVEIEPKQEFEDEPSDTVIGNKLLGAGLCRRHSYVFGLNPETIVCGYVSFHAAIVSMHYPSHDRNSATLHSEAPGSQLLQAPPEDKTTFGSWYDYLVDRYPPMPMNDLHSSSWIASHQTQFASLQFYTLVFPQIGAHTNIKKSFSSSPSSQKRIGPTKVSITDSPSQTHPSPLTSLPFECFIKDLFCDGVFTENAEKNRADQQSKKQRKQPAWPYPLTITTPFDNVVLWTHTLDGVERHEIANVGEELQLAISSFEGGEMRSDLFCTNIRSTCSTTQDSSGAEEKGKECIDINGSSPIQLLRYSLQQSVAKFETTRKIARSSNKNYHSVNGTSNDITEKEEDSLHRTHFTLPQSFLEGDTESTLSVCGTCPHMLPQSLHHHISLSAIASVATMTITLFSNPVLPTGTILRQLKPASLVAKMLSRYHNMDVTLDARHEEYMQYILKKGELVNKNKECLNSKSNASWYGDSAPSLDEFASCLASQVGSSTASQSNNFEGQKATTKPRPETSTLLPVVLPPTSLELFLRVIQSHADNVEAINRMRSSSSSGSGVWLQGSRSPYCHGRVMGGSSDRGSNATASTSSCIDDGAFHRRMDSTGTCTNTYRSEDSAGSTIIIDSDSVCEEEDKKNEFHSTGNLSEGRPHMNVDISVPTSLLSSVQLANTEPSNCLKTRENMSNTNHRAGAEERPSANMETIADDENDKSPQPSMISSDKNPYSLEPFFEVVCDLHNNQREDKQTGDIQSRYYDVNADGLVEDRPTCIPPDTAECESSPFRCYSGSPSLDTLSGPAGNAVRLDFSRLVNEAAAANERDTNSNNGVSEEICHIRFGDSVCKTYGDTMAMRANLEQDTTDFLATSSPLSLNGILAATAAAEDSFQALFNCATETYPMNKGNTVDVNATEEVEDWLGIYFQALDNQENLNGGTAGSLTAGMTVSLASPSKGSDSRDIALLSPPNPYNRCSLLGIAHRTLEHQPTDVLMSTLSSPQKHEMNMKTTKGEPLQEKTNGDDDAVQAKTDKSNIPPPPTCHISGISTSGGISNRFSDENKRNSISGADDPVGGTNDAIPLSSSQLSTTQPALSSANIGRNKKSRGQIIEEQTIPIINTTSLPMASVVETVERRREAESPNMNVKSTSVALLSKKVRANESKVRAKKSKHHKKNAFNKRCASKMMIANKGKSGTPCDTKEEEEDSFKVYIQDGVITTDHTNCQQPHDPLDHHCNDPQSIPATEYGISHTPIEELVARHRAKKETNIGQEENVASYLSVSGENSCYETGLGSEHKHPISDDVPYFKKALSVNSVSNMSVALSSLSLLPRKMPPIRERATARDNSVNSFNVITGENQHRNIIERHSAISPQTHSIQPALADDNCLFSAAFQELLKNNRLPNNSAKCHTLAQTTLITTPGTVSRKAVVIAGYPTPVASCGVEPTTSPRYQPSAITPMRGATTSLTLPSLSHAEICKELSAAKDIILKPRSGFDKKREMLDMVTRSLIQQQANEPLIVRPVFAQDGMTENTDKGPVGESGGLGTWSELYSGISSANAGTSFAPKVSSPMGDDSLSYSNNVLQRSDPTQNAQGIPQETSPCMDVEDSSVIRQLDMNYDIHEHSANYSSNGKEGEVRDYNDSSLDIGASATAIQTLDPSLRHRIPGAAYTSTNTDPAITLPCTYQGNYIAKSKEEDCSSDNRRAINNGMIGTESYTTLDDLLKKTRFERPPSLPPTMTDQISGRVNTVFLCDPNSAAARIPPLTTPQYHSNHNTNVNLSDNKISSGCTEGPAANRRRVVTILSPTQNADNNTQDGKVSGPQPAMPKGSLPTTISTGNPVSNPTSAAICTRPLPAVNLRHSYPESHKLLSAIESFNPRIVLFPPPPALPKKRKSNGSKKIPSPEEMTPVAVSPTKVEPTSLSILSPPLFLSPENLERLQATFSPIAGKKGGTTPRSLVGTSSINRTSVTNNHNNAEVSRVMTPKTIMKARTRARVEEYTKSSSDFIIRMNQRVLLEASSTKKERGCSNIRSRDPLFNKERHHQQLPSQHVSSKCNKSDTHGKISFEEIDYYPRSGVVSHYQPNTTVPSLSDNRKKRPFRDDDSSDNRSGGDGAAFGSRRKENYGLLQRHERPYKSMGSPPLTESKPLIQLGNIEAQVLSSPCPSSHIKKQRDSHIAPYVPPSPAAALHKRTATSLCTESIDDCPSPRHLPVSHREHTKKGHRHQYQTDKYHSGTHLKHHRHRQPLSSVSSSSSRINGVRIKTNKEMKKTIRDAISKLDKYLVMRSSENNNMRIQRDLPVSMAAVNQYSSGVPGQPLYGNNITNHCDKQYSTKALPSGRPCPPSALQGETLGSRCTLDIGTEDNAQDIAAFGRKPLPHSNIRGVRDTGFDGDYHQSHHQGFSSGLQQQHASHFPHQQPCPIPPHTNTYLPNTYNNVHHTSAPHMWSPPFSFYPPQPTMPSSPWYLPPSNICVPIPQQQYYSNPFSGVMNPLYHSHQGQPMGYCY